MNGPLFIVSDTQLYICVILVVGFLQGEIQSASGRVAPEQSSLRTAKNFHSLDVNSQVGTPEGPNLIDAIYVSRDGRLDLSRLGVWANAADGYALSAARFLT